MPSTTVLKLVLAVVGLLLFAVGIRMDNDVMRWAAIGIMAIAFLLRFVRQQ